jgi:hypothetical protein
MNIRTIVLVILGLVLVSAIVLSTTALASVLILGDFHWKRVVVAAGFWLLVFGCWFLAASLQQCIAAASKDAHPAAIIREANAVRRVSCLHVDARIQEQRDAKSRNQQPRRVSPEMASKPRDVCHGALLSQCSPLTW